MARRQDTVQRRGYWAEQLSKAQRVYETFHTNGDKVIDRYRMEGARQNSSTMQDRYNILYSSTETIKPSLYAQTPKPEIRKRHRDRANETVGQAVLLLETCIEYAIEENEFDEVMMNAVEDYALPGLGHAWVRYEATFKDQTDSAGNAVMDDKGKPAQVVDSENVVVDYVHWKDALFGPCRTFKELPWGARRVYFSKEKAVKRFGQEKADKLEYIDAAANDDRKPVADRQAVIWEIWNKADSEVLWYSEGYADDLLDVQKDPLKLKGFWPFPKPLRAISTTSKFVPRPFYSQYQSQAEELDNLTARIRHLTNALQVRGVYDSSVNELQHLLSPSGGNKMVAVQNWHQFIGQNGIQGSIQWVPIKDVVGVLMELYKARDIVKAEIYEITGFSDIVRGQSKASETLGAQQIKQDWASARLRVMQREVQRFARDLVRLIGEVISEHFSIESFALYSGFEPPQLPADYQQQAQAAVQAGQPAPPDPRQQAIEQFKQVIEMLKSERERCALIGIETDSTILADEEGERKDRLDFLGAVGAFMQQAAPTAQQFPEMAGLLGAMMMFSVRSFRAARPMEQEFEKFQSLMANKPPTPPNDPEKAKADAATQVITLKTQADAAKQDKELQFKASEAEKDRVIEQQRMSAEAQQAQVQLQIKNAELEIKRVELAIKEAELGIKAHQAVQTANDAEHARTMETDEQQHQHAMDIDGANREDRQFEQGREDQQINSQQPPEAP